MVWYGTVWNSTDNKLFPWRTTDQYAMLSTTCSRLYSSRAAASRPDFAAVSPPPAISPVPRPVFLPPPPPRDRGGPSSAAANASNMPRKEIRMVSAVVATAVLTKPVGDELLGMPFPPPPPPPPLLPLALFRAVSPTPTPPSSDRADSPPTNDLVTAAWRFSSRSASTQDATAERKALVDDGVADLCK